MKERAAQGGEPPAEPTPGKTSTWDHSSHDHFYDYYAKESLSQKTVDNFRSIRDNILRILEKIEGRARRYDVADIGCEAGTQSLLWAELGHHVHGVDVKAPLVELARQRAAAAGYAIDFRVGSATDLPWDDESIDVCLAAELIEHIVEWRNFIEECARVLRPGGVLLLATSNKLWPLQKEFNLPLYSWHPARLKRHFERLAMTTRPQLANYAKYPAVNWFTPYGLRRVLAQSGFQCLDRFDLTNTAEKSPWARSVISSIRAVPLLRWLANLCSPGIILLGVKRRASGDEANNHTRTN